MHSVRKSLGVQGLQPLVRGHIKPGDNICKRWERKLGKEAGKGSWERKLGKDAGKEAGKGRWKDAETAAGFGWCALLLRFYFGKLGSAHMGTSLARISNR
ncbi:hypothetical protein CesoFtcFv8_022910 [Champsocephalus esox]|uniref:Uncharacterized protein n=1 Tax=Champsocephalus esox TaxID=159716 RepID=A0AAN8B758_9TELE|nr:hypothetical protein CesoFtcFv8_022910 [Champsocephalus esox]